MSKYRKKTEIIEAVQWLSQKDEIEGVVDYGQDLPSSTLICENCGEKFGNHGSIEVVGGWKVVCPGDWIISGEHGKKQTFAPKAFEFIYEKCNVNKKPKDYRVEGKESLKAGDNGLPDWIPLDAWNGYIEMRKSKKFLLTDRAKSLLVKKLEAFKKDGWNLETLLDEATLGNWKSVYLPDNKSATKGQRENKSHFGEHVELTEERLQEINAKNNASLKAFEDDIASLEQGD